jgi:4-amino-4-deoxy-L-arabinose transferase-like glycosyltransferase
LTAWLDRPAALSPLIQILHWHGNLIDDFGDENPMKRIHIILLLLVGAAFMARLGYSLFKGIGREPGTASADASYYSHYAWNLAQGKGLSGPEPGREGDAPSALIPPGLPAFYAAIYVVFGKNYAVVRLAQCLLSAVTVILIFALAKAILNERAAWVAATALAFYPVAIYYSDEMLSETLYTFFLLLSFWLCIVWFAPRPTVVKALLCGGVLGLTALIRPVILPFLPLVVLWGLFVLKGARAKSLVLAVTAGAALVILSWSYRNYRLFHTFVLVAPRTWTEILGGNNPVVASDPKYAGYCIWYTQVPGWEHKFDGVPQIEREAVAKQLALQWLSENKDKWGYLLRSKFLRFWSPFLRQENRLNRLVMLASWGSVLPFFIPAAFVTLVRFWREKNPAILIHLLILSTLLNALIFYGLPRYRYPMEPFCIILASASVIWMWDRICRKPVPA